MANVIFKIHLYIYDIIKLISLDFIVYVQFFQYKIKKSIFWLF